MNHQNVPLTYMTQNNFAHHHSQNCPRRFKFTHRTSLAQRHDCFPHRSSHLIHRQLLQAKLNCFRQRQLRDSVASARRNTITKSEENKRMADIQRVYRFTSGKIRQVSDSTSWQRYLARRATWFGTDVIICFALELQF